MENENGNYYIVYWESYKDNGKESGNYYLRFRFGFGYEGLGY